MDKFFVKVNQDGYMIDYLSVGFLNAEEANMFNEPEGFIELDYNPYDLITGNIEAASESSSDDLFFDPNVKEIKSVLMFNVNKQRFEYVSKAIKNETTE